MGQPGRIDVVERPDPVPGPHEALVRVDAVGICGSDLHGFTGETPRRPPGMVMGHEIGGQVLSCADRPELTGQAVTVFPVLSCGACDDCRRDHPQICREAKIIGVTPDLPGGFAEYLVVPAANVVPIPVADPRLAALVEPAAVAVHAVELGRVDGGSVLVVGAGAIGLLAVVAARWLGAAGVWSVDIAPDRLARAARLGATVPAPDERDHPGWALAATGGGVDVTIDAVGSSASLATALAATRPGGRVVVVGMGQPQVELALFDIVTRERSVIGSFCYSRRTFEWTAGQLAKGGLGDVDELVGMVVSLHGAGNALRRLASGAELSPRVLISPSGAAPARTAAALAGQG
jgi:threonine dehydrogenase-like Zn-dependent dehydrogenase